MGLFGHVKCVILIALFLFFPQILQSAEPASDFVCPKPAEELPTTPRSKVYDGAPFRPGEEARYELKYGGLKILVGYGFLRVGKPQRHGIVVSSNGDAQVERKRLWHRVFKAEAYTGDWYRYVFRGHDKMLALSRPWNFAVSKFYLDQDEEKPFVRKTRLEKWIDFDHFSCEVREKVLDHQKGSETHEVNRLIPGAVDVLGAFYKLRTYSFDNMKKVRFQVFSSGKTWWLEAHPVKREKVTVKAGTFDATKLKMVTFLGKEMQQKGDLSIWIATKHPHRPIVKIEGEVTFGSIYLLLDKFTPSF